MKLYYYFLYRIYMFYKDTLKEKYFISFSVVTVSTVVIFIGLYTIYLYLDFIEIVPMFSNKFYVIPIMLSLGVFNFYFFIKPMKFLELNFKKDTKGGILVILFLLFITLTYVLVANKNRLKINKEISFKIEIEHVKTTPTNQTTFHF